MLLQSRVGYVRILETSLLVGYTAILDLSHGGSLEDSLERRQVVLKLTILLWAVLPSSLMLHNHI